MKISVVPATEGTMSLGNVAAYDVSVPCSGLTSALRYRCMPLSTACTRSSQSPHLSLLLLIQYEVFVKTSLSFCLIEVHKLEYTSNPCYTTMQHCSKTGLCYCHRFVIVIWTKTSSVFGVTMDMSSYKMAGLCVYMYISRST